MATYRPFMLPTSFIQIVCDNGNCHCDFCRKVSRFKQQNLPAWQPILHGKTAYPMFLIAGVLFIPIGVVLLIVSQQIKEFSYDYTYCMNQNLPNTTCAEFLQSENKTGRLCYCSLIVSLEQFDKPVFIYYGLTNFFQNYRSYVSSRDDNQLRGFTIAPKNLRRECSPFKTTTKNNSSQVYGYAPCGSIANSLFNDTFTLYYHRGAYKVPLDRTDIAWKTDKELKFRNPKSWQSYTNPPNWEKPVWELDPEEEDNNGYMNEDLIVWMRTAALPNFQKLYRRVNHFQEHFFNGLPAGYYSIIIEYNYPVAGFKGTKSIIISETSILGGKNSFFGIAYITVGTISIVVGFLFLINMFWNKKSESQERGDHISIVTMSID